MHQAQKELMKTCYYLDYGKLEHGEPCLSRAIETAEAKEDFTTYIKAAVCYGNLLAQTERAGEAVHWLKRALDRYEMVQPDDDMLDTEMNLAQQLIKQRAGRTS
ncbi:hypothetical protein [Paenibacillus sp. GCM10012303]|jgi:hypothetical protein|uniref:hypothetical protein n=1 Tax=Paenibacillus sp. GCM10012303 TaxID=3317340 RepID=UPI00361D5ADF